MCFIELVDYNENMSNAKAVKKATRTRRSKKSTSVENPSTETVEPVVEESAKAE